jgi:hypothetical protein
MNKIRNVSVALLAVFAVGALAASSASAYKNIEFKKASGGFTKNHFKGNLTTGAKPILRVPSLSTKIECKTEKSEGEITAAMTAVVKGPVVTKKEETGVTFTECVGENSKKETCSVKTPNRENAKKVTETFAAGEIATVPLSGELGQTKSTEATTETALNLKPTSGTTFVSVEGSCLPISPTNITGSVAGEATPVNTSQLTGKLVFGLNGTKQKIQTVCLLPLGTGALGATGECPETSVKDKPKLIAFLVEATQETSETLEFEENTEVARVN